MIEPSWVDAGLVAQRCRVSPLPLTDHGGFDFLTKIENNILLSGFPRTPKRWTGGARAGKCCQSIKSSSLDRSENRGQIKYFSLVIFGPRTKSPSSRSQILGQSRGLDSCPFTLISLPYRAVLIAAMAALAPAPGLKATLLTVLLVLSAIFSRRSESSSLLQVCSMDSLNLSLRTLVRRSGWSWSSSQSLDFRWHSGNRCS